MDREHGAFRRTLPGSDGFTRRLEELDGWDWMETPLGMVYLDTRRYGDKVWVRVADFILPNQDLVGCGYHVEPAAGDAAARTSSS